MANQFVGEERLRDEPKECLSRRLVRIWKTFLLCQEMFILKVSCFPWGVFWSPACAKKVITEKSEATPQSYVGAN